MTVQELTGFIGALGFPIALVIGGLWFLKKDLFPWFIADQKARREAEAARHSDYIKSYEKSTETQEIMTRAFIEFATVNRSQHDAQSDQASGNHNEVVGILRNEVITRLDKIDRNTATSGGMLRNDRR